MRAVLMAMFVMLAGQRAEACPHGTVCVSAETRSQVREVEAAARAISPPRSMLFVAISQAERTTLPARQARLAVSLRTHVAPRTSANEMPWVWVQLRRTVYSKMPRYDRVARRPENKFSLVLSPVVVESPQDTVPGVGVEGGF